MSNEIVKRESPVSLFGLDARAFNVVMDTANGRIRNQTIKASRNYSEGGRKYRMVVELRFDDECNNGHETFAITADTYDSLVRQDNGWVAGGCQHEEIAKRFPELAHLIKWHLVSTDGPMYYLANTCYAASERDHNGLLAGEKRQITNGRTGLPAWHLVAVDKGGNEVEVYKVEKYIASQEKPDCPYTLEYRPWCTVGEGKARDFDGARRCAVWPDATEEELSLPRAELEAKLTARLPALLEAFKADMLACGFMCPEHKEDKKGGVK